MPHGRHIYVKAYDLAKAKMCAYSQSDHVLPHWKCVLKCCAKCPKIHLPAQETYYQYPDTSPSIIFQIYHLNARCTKHVSITLTYRGNCRKCQQDTAWGQSTKINTIKELVMMDTTISNFHTSFYIPAIKKLAFHIPHVQILGRNHCGDYCRTYFKRHS